MKAFECVSDYQLESACKDAPYIANVGLPMIFDVLVD